MFNHRHPLHTSSTAENHFGSRKQQKNRNDRYPMSTFFHNDDFSTSIASLAELLIIYALMLKVCSYQTSLISMKRTRTTERKKTACVHARLVTLNHILIRHYGALPVQSSIKRSSRPMFREPLIMAYDVALEAVVDLIDVSCKA
jgi:hypothetical protein